MLILIAAALLVFALATVIVEAQDRGLGRGLKSAVLITILAPTALLLIGTVFAAPPGEGSRHNIADGALALIALASVFGLVVSFAEATVSVLPPWPSVPWAVG